MLCRLSSDSWGWWLAEYDFRPRETSNNLTLTDDLQIHLLQKCSK